MNDKLRKSSAHLDANKVNFTSNERARERETVSSNNKKDRQTEK